MKKRMVFGLSLIVLGLIIIFIQPLSGLTGFSIAESVGGGFITLLYFGGIMSVITGMGLVVTTPRESLATTLEDHIDRSTSQLGLDGQKPFVLLDSNFFIYNFQRDKTKSNRGINYLAATRYVQHLVEDKGYHVIIPRAVEEEFLFGPKGKKNPEQLKKVRRILKDRIKTLDFSNFPEYDEIRRGEAKEFLEATPKYKRGELFINFINYERGKLAPLNLQNILDRFTSYLNAVDIKKAGLDEKKGLVGEFSEYLGRFRRWVKAKYRADVNKRNELTDLNTPEAIDTLITKIKKRYQEIDNDADVLASAIYGKRQSKNPVPVYLVSSDEHLVDSFKDIRERYPNLAKKVFIVNPSKENIIP